VPLMAADGIQPGLWTITRCVEQRDEDATSDECALLDRRASE